MKYIDGGVCAPVGYTANGIYCGIRKAPGHNDLSLVFSEKRASAAAVYTTNLVKGAPLDVTREHISDGYAQAVICNSGNANTCNADGMEIAEQTCRIAAEKLGIRSEDVVIGSTGVIGQRLRIEPIMSGIDSLVSGLSKEGAYAAAEGIMTTDTVHKEAAVQFEINGVTCTIGGMAKGSGMIHPNMATMLAFITSDTAISPEMLKRALSSVIDESFNMISVDGDTSTNDMVAVLANGMAGNEEICTEGEAYETFRSALFEVCRYLARKMAADGEGASKLIECVVSNAADKQTAVTVSKSIICSNLLKCAIFGADANWGRVLCAIGYSGADVDIHKIDVRFRSEAGEVLVCEDGAGVDFSEEEALEILKKSEIQILVDLKSGETQTTAWGCDLTYEYVNINGSYRS